MHIALMLIDAQNDFMLPGAPLCLPGAWDQLPVMRALLDKAREAGWPVLHVTREHRQDGMDIEIARTAVFQAGLGACIQGTRGAEIVEALTPTEGEFRVQKRRFSAFVHTDLELLLRRLGTEMLIIAGHQYPTSIRATVMDAVSLDYQAIVVTDACCARTPAIADANVADMRDMGVPCVPLAELDAVIRSFDSLTHGRLSNC